MNYNITKRKHVAVYSLRRQLSPNVCVYCKQDNQLKLIMSDQNESANDGEEIVRQRIATAMSSMLPATSSHVYRSAWHDLQDYRALLNLTGPTTIRHVFSFLAKKYADKVWVSPGTLWTRYSMLRMMIKIREGNVVDDGAILACESWLKGLSRVHTPKQSNQLTKEQVARFLVTTQHTQPIDVRLLLVFGFNLGLRTVDLKKLQWSNVSRHADGLRITVDWATKTDQGARGNWYFIAKEDDPRVCGVALFAEYHRIVQEADPQRLNGELWLKVVKTKAGKWSVISTRGRNWLTSIPSMVARELGLPDAESYTGHCFRRTSAQWQADAGATTLELQNQFGWKNPAMASVYTGQSTVARSASSRRCLLSGDVPLIAESSVPTGRAEEAPQSSAGQSRSNAELVQRLSPPQTVSVPPGVSMPWPVKISGQNINIYFGGSPACGSEQQKASTSDESLSQRRLAVKSDAGEKEVCADSDLEDALISEYEWESSCSKDMAILLPEVVTAIGEEQAAETETVAVGTLTKGKRKNATRKSMGKVKKAVEPKIKPKAKPEKVIGIALPPQIDEDSNAGTNNTTGRPQRVRAIITHSNPYSRNTRGFIDPNA